MPAKKILIITYYWPPSGGVGVQRWMNFALQLHEKGWDVSILTPENPQFEISDNALLERVKDLKVYKLPIWEPFDLFHKITGNKDRKNVKQGLVMEKSKKSFFNNLTVWIRGNFFVPDPRIFWVKKASKFVIDLIKKESIDTIITTGPPHSIHLIGRKVKNRTGVKWLADFRDPWSKWDVLPKLKTSDLVMDMHSRMEKSVLAVADDATTVSARLAKSLGDINVLHNGITVNNEEEQLLSNSTFTIGYFGMLNDLRNPRQLWQLLDQMCRENETFSKKLKIKIGGIVSESITEEILALEELKGKVEFLGYLSHETILKEYRKCHLLLLLQNKTNNSQWILPVKFFEYLAANRMILALGERTSDLGDLMIDRNVGEILEYSDVEAIRAFITQVFTKGEKPDELDIKELIGQFSHTNLVKKLEDILTRMHE